MEERRIEIYHGGNGEVIFDIDANLETLWASEDQIAQVFGVDRSVINRHIRNIYRDGELVEKGTCAKNAQVRMEGNRKVMREVRRYNLDVIISVGYRVNSRKATDFRIWATKVLKSYVVNGVAINEKRLKELDAKRLEQIEGTLSIVKRLMEKSELETQEASGILEIISKYAGSFHVIKEFSEGHVSFGTGKKVGRGISVLEMENLVESLRDRENAGEEFGKFRDEVTEEKFYMELNKLNECGKSVTQKAVELLHYVVRREPFLEGNGRIGALLFVFYLTVNDCHLTENGETKLSDRALTALVLLIKESEEKEKDLVVAVACKLIEG